MKYRITPTFPVYFNGDCLPSTGYVLQVLQEGFFRDKWVEVKTFAKKENAEKILKMLQ